jgi:hypothetical protein
LVDLQLRLDRAVDHLVDEADYEALLELWDLLDHCARHASIGMDLLTLRRRHADQGHDVDD